MRWGCGWVVCWVAYVCRHAHGVWTWGQGHGAGTSPRYLPDPRVIHPSSTYLRWLAAPCPSPLVNPPCHALAGWHGSCIGSDR